MPLTESDPSNKNNAATEIDVMEDSKLDSSCGDEEENKQENTRALRKPVVVLAVDGNPACNSSSFTQITLEYQQRNTAKCSQGVIIIFQTP